jgi:tetratricopeptide (TPR) repeat protein
LNSRPNYAIAHCNLGVNLAAMGRVDDAITHYRIALDLNPTLAEASYNLGSALVSQGRFAEAASQYRTALRLKPEAASIYNQLARLLATCPDASVRNGSEAIALAQQAAKLTNGREPMILDTLAAAYAEAGQYREAVQTAKQAVQLATQQHQPALSESIQSRLQLYETRTPFWQK